MCGISVILTRREHLLPSINKMVGSMMHRGPDMQDIYIDDQLNVALGHNRLSILDLSVNGKQPFISSDGRYVLTYNGEIYNYLDLKKQLTHLGYQFITTTDTEVVLYGYQQWGEDLFLKLNGMWAFAILDRFQQNLILSRDRFGIKPLYYYQKSDTFICASEVKGILSTGLIKADVNLNALNEYFTFQNVISEQTLFKDVFMVEPGYNLYVDIKSNKSTKRQYWDVDYNSNNQINEQNFCNELYDTLQRSVNKILIADVPIGATISGGMDSSSIVALASNNIAKFKTFTGYFDHDNLAMDDVSFNEHHDARLISQFFGTDHFEIKISSSDLTDTFAKVVWHLEDPKVGMCYTFYLINQLLKKQVTVNLSGTGGDEILGGYPWRYSLINNCNTHQQFSDTYYNYWSRLVKDCDKKKFFTPKILKQIDVSNPRYVFDKLIEPRKNESSLNKALYFELKTFLHGMLIVEDKMGMAHSVETRFPFLENDIVQLTTQIPEKYKFANNEAKLLLKKAFNKVLPHSIINKRKQGFTPPDQTWYRQDLSKYIDDLLLNHKANIHQYINRDYISNTLAMHQRGQDNRLLIWSLMFFEHWLRIFIVGKHDLNIIKHSNLEISLSDFK